MKQNNPTRLLHAALRHAHQTEEPRHEAGDLQDVVHACFEAMSEGQKKKVYNDWRVVELLSWEDEALA